MFGSLNWIKSKAVIGVILVFIPKLAEAAGAVLPPIVTTIMAVIGSVLGVGAARNWILQAGSFQKTDVKAIPQVSDAETKP